MSKVTFSPDDPVPCTFINSYRKSSEGSLAWKESCAIMKVGVLVLFYVLPLLNHVIAIVRKHRKGHQSAVFHSSAESTYKVSGVSQENVKGRKIASKKALLDDNDPNYYWYMNGTQMSKMPDDYFETTNCQTNITEGWKIDTCFVCVDETTSAEYGCKFHRVDDSIVRSVYHGTNCDSGVKDEAVENFHSAECGPGVIYAAREIYDGTPYLQDKRA